jgi:ParB family transcriptional regulator, chromosome partitioning protein
VEGKVAERFQNLGEGKIEGRKLDPRTIKIRKDFNYRDTESESVKAHIAWLKESIKAEGVEKPISVQYIGGEVYLVDGHCRVEACKQLFKEGVKVPYKSGGFGPPLIPALTVDSKNEADIIAASMVANGSLPPTKIEFGVAADRLLKLGWPVDKIALYIPAHVGVKGFKATRYVKEAVELHQAPVDVREAVQKGSDGVKLSDAAALKIARENPLDPKPAIEQEIRKAKAAGKTEAKRPKEAGKVTKAKAAAAKTVEQCLKFADALADVALDLTLDRAEVVACASKYNSARNR